jgi:LacI family transcriptional regulator
MAEPRTRKVVLNVETSSGYGRALLRGVVMYSREFGPWTFHWETWQPERTSLEALQRWEPDGLILRDSQTDNARLLSLKVPTVIVSEFNKQVHTLPYVTTDCAAIGKMAAEHLLERGLEHYAYCGWEDVFWSADRGRAFQQRLKEAGFVASFYESPDSRFDRSWPGEEVYLVRWLGSLPKPVGVMACSDDRARLVALACRTAALRVPQDVAIIGVDDEELVCELTDPPLSSVALNTMAAGYDAAKVLHAMMAGDINGQSPATLIHPTHVVSRRSTDTLAVTDEVVVQALEFIRQNARIPLSVGDVVDHVPLSRRALEVRFQKVLRRSISDEIGRARAAQVASLLQNTNMSIAELTAALRFSSSANLVRFFKRQIGVSPTTYREQFSLRKK